MEVTRDRFPPYRTISAVTDLKINSLRQKEIKKYTTKAVHTYIPPKVVEKNLLNKRYPSNIKNKNEIHSINGTDELESL
jgi:hypothetical protein